ncbi:MAG: hypothetical protein DRQ55_04785 [Planctomycetota bacterium]|nr:MAG: hypothetical protein DRQ55_04785 [Planctomycetota bacterium]
MDSTLRTLALLWLAGATAVAQAAPDPTPGGLPPHAPGQAAPAASVPSPQPGQAPPVHVRHVTQAPIHIGLWDPVSQAALPGAGPLDASQVFDNRQWNGAVMFPGTDLVVMDWGQMSSTPENEVFAATVSYATADPAPVDLTLRLHPLAKGQGDPGRVQVELPLRGLPGSPDGALTVFTVEVSLAETLIPDGAFAWSYELGAASTGIALVDPSVEAGIDDLLDLYTSELDYLTSFQIGGAAFASLYLGLVGSYPGVNGWPSVGSVLPGSSGYPGLLVAGPLSTASVNLVDVSGALPGALVWLVIGAPRIDAPFKGGVMIPEPLSMMPLMTDGLGHAHLPWLQLVPVPAGVDVFVQAWFVDPGVAQGWAATAGAQGITH